MSSRRSTFRRSPFLAAAAVAGLALAAPPRALTAQDLHGSRASVEKMYAFAVNHRLSFYHTPESVDSAAARGELVQLAGGPGWELSSGVGWSYARPEAVAFLDQFGPEYEEACQAPLVITSATRPLTKRPRNGVAESVHPAGIAIDMRKPYAGPCRDWLRKRLSELEGEGKIEATEEFHPPHFHVAVLARPGSAPPRAVQALAASAAAVARQLGTSGDVPWGARLPNRGPTFSGPLFQSALDAFRGMPRLPAVVVVAQPPAGGAALAATKRQGPVVTTASSGAIAPSSHQNKTTTSAEETYVVRQGDTAWDIAKKHGVTVAALMEANGLGKKGRIKPKMELKIPGAKAAN